MTKNFKQQLADLRRGLAMINQTIKQTRSRIKYEKAKRVQEIQMARIEFFKLGYALRDKELKAQRKLTQ